MKHNELSLNGFKAFTLTELLVCIMVLSLLVSIMTPALKSARDKGRSCVCKAHLRQWHLSMVCYADENNSYIPRRGQGVKEISKINRPGDWFNALPVCVGYDGYYDRAQNHDLPIIDSKRRQDLFICPGARLTKSTYFMPLAMNMYLSPWIRPNPHRFVEIRQPTTLVFMADSPGPYSATLPSNEGYNVEDRHTKFANLVMLDGHVDGFSGTQLGCGTGVPDSSPIRWDTKTTGVNQIFFHNAGN